MKKVIALKGRSNIGKTSTLKLFNDMLTDNFPPVNIEHHIDGKDIRVVYTLHGGIKVGIETQGDPYSRLPDSLGLFDRLGCKLIICACRSSGATVEAVESLKPKYVTSFRGQSSVSLKEWRKRSNSNMASMLLEEASEAINA